MSNNKDWNGNGNSIFKTLGASNHTEKERETDDFYATDPVAIDLLCDYHYVKLPHGVWEPSCGSGCLSERLRQRGYHVVSTDLVDRGYGLGGVNFFEQREMPEGCAAIVTNPPYKYATEYVLHALRLLPTDGLLCLFLKTTFAEGKERYQRIFGVTPPALVLQCSERVLCAKNADFDGMIAGGGSAVSYAWWVWRKGWSGQTTLDWINHPSAQQAVQLELFKKIKTMAKKRKNKNQDWDDWEDEPDVQELQPDVEVAKVSLRDFIVPEKVSAFVNGYAPCNEGDDGYEQFDDARLREVFKAYVCGLGDPLKLYVEDLQAAGFRMECSMATGEPCVFARRKR